MRNGKMWPDIALPSMGIHFAPQMTDKYYALVTVTSGPVTKCTLVYKALPYRIKSRFLVEKEVTVACLIA